MVLDLMNSKGEKLIPTMELIQKTREYLDYLEEHVKNVEKAWQIVQEKCKDMCFIYDDFVYGCIDLQIKHHDMSKLSAAEFTQYRKNFFPAKDEVMCKEEFLNAIQHHKRCNAHHWENWTNIVTNNPYELEINCIHMVIDWMAISFKFGDTAQSYYEKNKYKMNLPAWSVDLINEIFKRVY